MNSSQANGKTAAYPASPEATWYLAAHQSQFSCAGLRAAAVQLPIAHRIPPHVCYHDWRIAIAHLTSGDRNHMNRKVSANTSRIGNAAARGRVWLITSLIVGVCACVGGVIRSAR